MPPTLHPATAMLHGAVHRTEHNETSEALFLTSGFVYGTAEDAAATFRGEQVRFQYTRFGNPTIAALEARLCILEGAEACRVTATGMAAVHAALLCQLNTGDRLVASRALFGSCHWIVSTLLPRYGIRTEFVDGHDLAAWEAALRAPAAMVLLESPSNPMLDLVDIAAVSALAHAAGALVVVDNVFATPLLQRPLELGADVCVYSCTKHMDGQGRVMGGAVLGRERWVLETLQPFLRNTGPSLSPFNAWTLLKGLETLPLRVAAANAAATRLADTLSGHRAVKGLRYPGRADHPQAALAARQMSGGGTLITLDLHGGQPAAFAFLDALRIVVIANNLGDARSMATHPATTTHYRIGADERARLDIADGAVRLSVGLEDVRDLEADLLHALDAAAAA